MKMDPLGHTQTKNSVVGLKHETRGTRRYRCELWGGEVKGNRNEMNKLKEDGKGRE